MRTRAVRLVLEEAVPIKQLAGGISELEGSIRLPPFEPHAVPLYHFDQADLLKMAEVVG